jgi:hypothetical protein
MRIQLNQIHLLAAIEAEIHRQYPGTGFEERYFNAITKAAKDICTEFANPVVKASPGMGIAAWLASDDTGLSSKFMASVLTGEFKAENHYPRDPADFGRCLRLVNGVPGLAGRVGEMSQHGKHWAVVAANWDEWVEVYRLKDSERLYRLMKLCYEAGV